MKPRFEGKPPPKWFIDQSDGGSCPGGKFGKWALREPVWRPAAWWHDYGYYRVALQYPPGSHEWITGRFRADHAFKLNVRKCLPNRFMGWLRAKAYFRALRAFGNQSVRRPIKNPEEDKLAVPPGPLSRENLKKHLDKPMTARAKRQFAQWEKEEAPE